LRWPYLDWTPPRRERPFDQGLVSRREGARKGFLPCGGKPERKLSFDEETGPLKGVSPWKGIIGGVKAGEGKGREGKGGGERKEKARGLKG
jgi:hypothetical protein